MVGFLLLLLLSPFIFRRINKYMFKNKNDILKKFTAILSKYHMYFGFILLITAFIHGYSALGTIRMHSEYILWLWVFMQVLLGIYAKKKKKSKILNIHRLVGASTTQILQFAFIS